MQAWESLVNGEPRARVSVLDRGLAFGDGLFETLAVDRGSPLRWEAHMARLSRGCRRLGIPAPDPDVLLSEVEQLCARRARSVVKILVTRGEGGRGYALPSGVARPTRIVVRHEWPVFRRHALRLRMCQLRLGINPAVAGIKHLNRLEYVLARAEWNDEYDEGVLLDQAGAVVECVASNLFLWRSGVLYTPAIDRAGVAGVMRHAVMEAARTLGIPVRVGRFGQETLARAEGAFVTNAITGPRWVARIESWRFVEPDCLDALRNALDAAAARR